MLNSFNMDFFSLKGKVAIVTGGNTGLGQAYVVALAKAGADLFVVTYDRAWDETRAMVEAEGRRIEFFQADLTDRAQIDKVISACVETYGKIDILVNNAAVQYECKDFKQISDSQFDKTMKTNIYGTFYMTRESLKHMTSGSCIINTASVVAFKGNEKLVDYSMTKGAITALTRSLAIELAKAKKNIRVNEVAPGPIWTPLIQASFTKTEVASFGQNVAMGRAGQPVECAGAYVFLASDNASYITGQTIHVNGGEIVNS